MCVRQALPLLNNERVGFSPDMAVRRYGDEHNAIRVFENRVGVHFPVAMACSCHDSKILTPCTFCFAI